MKKKKSNALKIILIVLGVLLLSYLIFVIVMYNRDKNRMIQDASDVFIHICKDRTKANKAATCYINKGIDKYGFMKMLSINNGKYEPNIDEQNQLATFKSDCLKNANCGSQ